MVDYRLVTVQATVAVAAGMTAGSLVVLAFGLDSVIELTSAGVLMWRLIVELRHGQRFSKWARIAGALLFLLAAYIAAAALWHLGVTKHFLGRSSLLR